MSSGKNKLDVFISYGHFDADWEIVKAIVDYLDQKHYTVWIDKKDIESGNDWRRKIEEGIQNSNPILGLLSEYSTRDRSVCLDELAISVCCPEKRLITILLDPEKKISIPSSISRVQWLDMSDWREHKKETDEEFRRWFESKMEIVEDIIENENLYEFQGEINFLKQILISDCSDSKYREYLNKTYTRREWAEKRFDAFVRTEDSKRFFAVRGGPGFGKSHFIARQMHWNEKVVAGYFIEWNKKVPVNQMIRSIAFQLAARLPDYRLNLKRLFAGIASQDYNAIVSIRNEMDGKTPAELIDYLIVSQMPIINGNMDNNVIVIDGLDEAYHDGKNEFADVLASEVISRLPSWIKIVFTYRNEPGLCALLQKIDQETVLLDLNCDESNNDIAAYLKDRLAEYIKSHVIEEEYIEEIALKCEKTFIYAVYLCECFRSGIIEIGSPIDKIPQSISGIYYSYFNRLFADTSYESVRKPLGVIIANGGEITAEQLRFVMGWSEHEYRAFYETMKSFIIVRTEANDSIIRFYHKTVNEWLVDVDACGVYVADINDSIDAILSACRSCYYSQECAETPFNIQKYVYTKLLETGTIEDKRNVNTDFAFMQRLQEQAYHASDFAFANKMFSTIKYCYSIANTSVKKANRSTLARAYITYSESKIAGERGAIEEFIDIEKRFSDVMRSDVELYAMTEDNIVFLMRKEKTDEAEERILKLEEFIVSKDFDNKWYTIPQINYHHGLILELKGINEKNKGDDENKKGNYSKADAHYEQAKKHFILATEYLESAINGAETSYPLKMADDLIVRTQNPLAICYGELNDHKKACETARDSLKRRLRLYGKYSHYSALGYDNLARCENKRAMAKNAILPDSVYAMLQDALDIDTYIFGSKSGTTARHLQTFAILYKDDNRGDINRLYTARRYAKDALAVFESCDEKDPRTISTTKRIAEQIEQKINEHQ